MSDTDKRLRKLETSSRIHAIVIILNGLAIIVHGLMLHL